MSSKIENAIFGTVSILTCVYSLCVVNSCCREVRKAEAEKTISEISQNLKTESDVATAQFIAAQLDSLKKTKPTPEDLEKFIKEKDLTKYCNNEKECKSCKRR